MDSFTLAVLVEELNRTLQGARLDRVQQTSPTDLLLKFSRGRVFVSTDPQAPLLYLIKASNKPSVEPVSHLVLLARKHLVGARLHAVEQVKHDRIISFRFQAAAQYALVVELIDRRANVYLLDPEERVLGHLLAHGPELHGPGDPYVPPRSLGKCDPTQLSEGEFDRLVQGSSLSEAVLRRVAGFGPTLVREVVWRSREQPGYPAFRSVLDELQNTPPQPCLYAPAPLDQIRPAQSNWRTDLVLSCISLRWASEEAGLFVTPFVTMSEASERYGQLISEARVFQAQYRTLATTVRNRIVKGQRLVERLQNDMQRVGDFEQYRRWGDLLLANVSQARRGSRGFIVTDFYDAEQRMIEIPAESRITPQAAATAYFDLYRKGKRGVESIRQQISRAKEGLDRWHRLSEQLHAASTLSDLERLAEPILGRPLTESGEKETKRQAERIPGVYRFRSSEEYEILVGRSAQDNETLTFKLARPHDLWLHAADYPGSHVIVRRKSKKEPVPYQSLVEAAELAAYFSQARNSGKAVVHYTDRKYVNKIRGAAPGLVRLADFRSITVEPRIRAKRVAVEL
jgi:predicted ribosome quality control (RQC) complex YloA/Tae2 family protein